MPYVSVLVPIYGVEKYIERCAVSLFEQTYDNIEYVFVDDCSPDNSIQVLEDVLVKYPKRINQVRIIHHNQNRGISAARNTAVNLCSADFLMHVDSDDYLEKDAVEKLVAKQIDTGADIVMGDAIQHSSGRKLSVRDGEPTDRMDLVKFYIRVGTEKMLWGRLFRASLYKDYSVRELEGCDWCDDIQVLSILYYLSKSVAVINDVIYHYNFCTSPISITARISEANRIPQKVLQRIESFSILYYFYKSHKEDILVDYVERNLALYLMDAAVAHAKYKQKSMFTYVWKRFDIIDSRNKEILLEKDDRLYMFIIRNYYLCRLYSIAKAKWYQIRTNHNKK